MSGGSIQQPIYQLEPEATRLRRLIECLMLALVYGMKRLLKVSPHYTGLAQTYALWLNAEVNIWTDKITQPILSIKAWLDLILKREE